MRHALSFCLLTLFSVCMLSAQTESLEVVQILAPQSIRLNSGGYQLLHGGKSTYVLPVQLPPHTVSWYYVFSASRDEKRMKANLDRFNALGELSSLVDKYGFTPNLINFLTVVPGADYCNVYLANNYQDVLNFESGKGFQYSRMGSRPNYESGKVEIKDQLVGTQYLMFNNPDALSGVSVNLEVVAIVKKVQSNDNRVLIKNETDQGISFMLSQGVGRDVYFLRPKDYATYALLLKTGTVEIETQGQPLYITKVESYYDYYIQYNAQNQRFELFRY